MYIPVIVKTIKLATKKNTADAVIEFNSIEFNASIVGSDPDDVKIDIDGIDIKNLEKAGIILDFTTLKNAYKAELQKLEINKEEHIKKYRETVYLTTRLHELETVLAPHFSIMSIDEFLKSRSGALYAFYKVTYKGYLKEISIFMDRDKFIVYDQLNEKTITDYASDPAAVKKIIDAHIKHWKHKVDFKLVLMQHVDANAEHDPTEMISATEYFKHLHDKEAVHEDEIRENHEKYLNMLGKLGEASEIDAQGQRHKTIKDTTSMEKKRLLGSLSDTKKIKIKHLFD